MILITIVKSCHKLVAELNSAKNGIVKSTSILKKDFLLTLINSNLFFKKFNK